MGFLNSIDSLVLLTTKLTKRKSMQIYRNNTYNKRRLLM